MDCEKCENYEYYGSAKDSCKNFKPKQHALDEQIEIIGKMFDSALSMPVTAVSFPADAIMRRLKQLRYESMLTALSFRYSGDSGEYKLALDGDLRNNGHESWIV